jgi:mRNA interferase HigB
MRVISKARLKEFCEARSYQDSEGPLRAWYTHVNSKTISWRAWGDVKSDFGNASIVGNCVVFNIGGNKFRLITRVLYASQKVFVLKVMTHAEYDRNKWKDECGCFAPPPEPEKKRAPAKKPRSGR